MVRKILLLVLAGNVIMMVAGCSKAVVDKSQSMEAKGERWSRTVEEDDVIFKLNAKNSIQTAANQSTPYLDIACGKDNMIAFRISEPLPASASSKTNIGLVLDGAAPIRQEWFETVGHNGETMTPLSAEIGLHLLLQILEAKTLKVEFTPKGGSPQSATFSVLDLKDRFGHEPACASWRDLRNYQ